ncbi:hypothetical protein SMICM304S_07982 [Streptomyces microflavus]
MSVDDVEFRRRIRSDVPHSARVWNAWLGGKDNYPVDRELADAVSAACGRAAGRHRLSPSPAGPPPPSYAP